MKPNKLFPYVNVHTTSDYFNLPKEQREKWNIYLKPFALPMNIFDEEEDDNGWNKFKVEIRKHYPIQGWFREWVLSYDNPIYSFISHSITNLRRYRHNMRRFFRPAHPRFRKVYPRYRWMDISNAIKEINFAMIQDFWYEEVLKDIVDYQGDGTHQKFYDWIKDVINYIEVRRPELEKQLNAAYDRIDHKSKEPYNIKYKDVNKVEEELNNTDIHILKEMIDYKDFFWT